MILQALTAYHKRLLQESRAAQPGFQEKPIPFIIVLDRQGHFRGLTNTTSRDVRKGIPRTVPREVVRAGTKAWQKANLLWDNTAYVLGYSEGNQEDTARKRKTFINTIKDYFPAPVADDGVRAVLTFLERGDFSDLFKHPDWKAISESAGNITFQLEGEGLVCQRQTVVDAILQRESTNKGEKTQCLVSGQLDFPKLTTHGKIKGVKNAQTSGASLVSFNLHAFESYGKEQGANAPVGAKAEFAYVTAANIMLANLRQRIQAGDATTVFWAEKKHDFEGVFADIFGAGPAKGEPEQDYKQMLALFRSPERGARPELDPKTKFYVLGLAPNASRISVRFWYAGTVGSIAANIGQHFDDLDMVKGPKEWRTIALPWLLRATALRAEDKNIAPNLAGDTMKAILTGTPYPRTLLVSVINRTRAEQSKKDSNGKSIPNVTYTRAALIKAILARDTRYYRRNEKEVGMSLDTSNTSPGYLLGRLFAVLERAQESASPGINATIRDRFYGAASSTPVAVFPHLMKLKNYHIAKLENKGQAVNLEKQIGEIIGKLAADDAFPSHLALPEQGRFAVGYYHQRQDFFTKKDDNSGKSRRENNE